MLNKQLFARLLKYCHFNEQGILVTDKGYTAQHKVRVGKQLLTLKAVHFLSIHGFVPRGTLTHRSGRQDVVDCNHLEYKPYTKTMEF